MMQVLFLLLCFIMIPAVLLTLINCLGFGAGGIVAGSCAAWLMRILGPIAPGSLVACLQSLGALGITNPLLWVIALLIFIPLLLLYTCIGVENPQQYAIETLQQLFNSSGQELIEL